MTKKQNLALGLLSGFLILLFLGLKIYGSPIISSLYQNQSFQTLNFIIGSKNNSGEAHSLDYYLGEIEVVLLGPLQSIIAGLIFLIYAFIYLRHSSSLRFALAVFMYFLLTRPEVLLNPPFGEGITGPFSDAVWLVQNRLDYIGLLHQDTVMTGGPQIYPTALYPLFLAALMKLLPSTIAFLIVMHLWGFAMAATVVAILRRMIQKAMGNSDLALTTAILLLSLPLFQSMSELINLEMPCLFFAMLCVYYLSENKMGRAAISALAAVFTKDPGIIACGMVILFGIKNIFTGSPWKNQLKTIGWITFTTIIVLAKSTLRQILLGDQTVYKNCVLCGWVHMKIAPWFWIYIIALGILIADIILWLSKSKYPGTAAGRIKQLLLTYQDILLMFMMAGAWTFMFMNFSTMAYRHELLAIPFILFCIIYAADTCIKNKAVLPRLVIGLIMFSFLCSHGLIYLGQRLSTFYPTHLERSLEYRNYLRLEQNLAKEIERNYADRQIVSPFQTAQLLGLTELGYVHKELNVTVYGMRETLGLQPYRGWQALNDPIFVGFPHHRETFPSFEFPIDPRDTVLKKLEVGHLQVLIFQGGLGVESMWRLIQFLTTQNRQ